MSLRCFVAMAFDRDDTDKFYIQSIASTLRKSKITPIRIDRVEHNDDIDDRIITELRKCDFCVADLTYARPSVYFEAGYAQRQVPVIYTCRQDHFKPKPDDPFGNFRVHFDLQMKNIIAWKNPLDENFIKRFSRRINSVTKPIVRKQQSDTRRQNDQNSFSSLSTRQKMAYAFRAATNLARRSGYKVRDVLQHPFRTNYSLDSSVPIDVAKRIFKVEVLEPGCIGIKRNANSIHAAIIHVTPSANKNYFLHIQEALLSYPCYTISIPGEAVKVDSLVEHVFICSLKQIKTANVMHWLPELELNARGALTLQKTQQVPKASVRGREIYPLTTETYFAIKPGVAKQLGRIKEISLGTKTLLPEVTILKTKSVRDVRRTIYVHLVDAFQSKQEFAEEFKAAIEMS